MEQASYTLQIDLNSLNHLGLNLYSNVPAVLSELIANSWDADANKVDVSVSSVSNESKIIVSDDGCGMDADDLNQKFLTVGYERRKVSINDLTLQKKRKVMGRKGIGKLSIFSIAEYIQIFTKKDNKTIGLALDVNGIKKAIDKKEEYHPIAIESIPEEFKINTDTGTTIVLNQLKRRIFSSLDENLKKRIARRFSIFSDDFHVSVNDQQVSIQDRDYFHKLEYATVYGGYDKNNFKHDEKYINEREHKIKVDGKKYNVGGWIGLVEKSGSLQEGADNLNKLTILVRGKVALEGMLDQFREGGLYTKYLIGEIEADFLDLTDKEDIATSSRQNFLQSDERFGALKDFISNELKYIQNRRAEYKEDQGTEKAKEIPALKEWYESLRGDTQEAAKKLFGRINQIATDENHRKTLYKHGVLAFEHLHHKEKLNELGNLNINSLETAVKLFSELDDIEASWYHQITEGRLEVIRKLNENVQDDALEKILQQYIYNHLWLLDPSWDRATETPTMEKSITTEFKKISNKLNEEEKKGRIDIRYKKISGKHVIVELKRSSVQVSDGDLMNQVDKYRKALSKQIELNNEARAIEIICLVGKGLKGWDSSEEQYNSEKALEQKNIRVVTYQQLINDAEKAYKDYLDKTEEKGRIRKLLEKIENH